MAAIPALVMDVPRFRRQPAEANALCPFAPAGSLFRPPRRSLSVSRQADGLQPGGRARDHADCAFRQIEAIRQQPFERSVGGALSGTARTPRGKMDGAVRSSLHAVDRVGRRFRRQPHEKIDPVRPRPVAGGHAQTKSRRDRGPEQLADEIDDQEKNDRRNVDAAEVQARNGGSACNAGSVRRKSMLPIVPTNWLRGLTTLKA